MEIIWVKNSNPISNKNSAVPLVDKNSIVGKCVQNVSEG